MRPTVFGAWATSFRSLRKCSDALLRSGPSLRSALFWNFAGSLHPPRYLFAERQQGIFRFATGQTFPRRGHGDQRGQRSWADRRSDYYQRNTEHRHWRSELQYDTTDAGRPVAYRGKHYGFTKGVPGNPAPNTHCARATTACVGLLQNQRKTKARRAARQARSGQNSWLVARSLLLAQSKPGSQTCSCASWGGGAAVLQGAQGVGGGNKCGRTAEPLREFPS